MFNCFPFHYFFPLAITTFYTTEPKIQLKPLVLSLTPWYLSNQVWYAYSESSNSQPHVPFLFCSTSLHFLSSSFPSAVLQFNLLPIASNSFFGFKANLNCIFLQRSIKSWTSFMKLFDNSHPPNFLFLNIAFIIYTTSHLVITYNTALLHSIKSQCITEN